MLAAAEWTAPRGFAPGPVTTGYRASKMGLRPRHATGGDRLETLSPGSFHL